MHAEFTSAQNMNNSHNSNHYADSAMYYFQLCQTARGIDTATFEKATIMVDSMALNRNAFDQIATIAQNFMDQNKPFFANYINQVLIYKITRSDSVDFAIRYCDNIITAYDASQDPDDRYTALLALMEIRIPLRIKSMPDAFDYYASRLKLYLEKKDSSGLSISYFCLGSNYRITGLPDMTIYNFKKSLSYINKKDTLTNIQISGLGGWMNNMSALGQLYLEVGDYPSAIAYSREAKDIRIHQLKQLNVSYLNCNIAYAHLMLNELDSVNDLLSSAIQLASEYGDYPSLVRTYEIKGQYFIAMHMLDSAEANLQKAKEVMRLHHVDYFSPAGIHTPDYYLAQVRILQNRYADARTLLEQEISKIGNIKKEVLKEQKLLIAVYHKLGDSAAADSTFTKYSDLQTELSIEERKNRTKSFEVESKIEDAENTISDLITEKRIADVTKRYLIGIAALLLIVAIIIFNRFRVTRKQKVIIEKEKHRSEELLLNILPAEVAEELKDKGSADAKHFDEVTVLFTDFKGFTQFSEKLTPTELVEEINACFSAFDHIMQKHGVEKIKTIGDAYMAAGGLPVSNKTHAEDVIKAGLEIQQFMLDHKQKKQAAGEMFFEIRIGIHTGPVVAGIVGVKKFAYDIWGDTVNTASRMESSGEAGKVNISGNTYALIKDKFTCIYRGKIEAKNKGQIDMYFVEAIA